MRCGASDIFCTLSWPQAQDLKASVNSHNQKQYKSILIQDVCGLVRPGLSACFCAGPGWVWSLSLLPGARASRCSQVE
ncbi:hypothetical protein PGIGA_G00161410 [Pangasianodon gigas]|uniref:Uncharacterized protein n=1 Tax=Pangasianodon gigas TaxID=30993 RepID=A0ACC5XS42_PANGG|nr:hypothetical protein [Pangasianodon gigas]